MITVQKAEYPGTEKQLQAALNDFSAQLEAHKDTEGVPAPFPDYEIFRVILADGGTFILQEDVIEGPGGDDLPVNSKLNAIYAGFKALVAKGVVTKQDLPTELQRAIDVVVEPIEIANPVEVKP